MKPPKCRYCGHAHWLRDPHIFTETVAQTTHGYSVVANSTPDKVANISTRHGQYADKDKRRQYMREYMRADRASKRVSAH